ncbi:hypothetical protein MMC07_009739 [Pseudocyphellaria aurata]|nr:hypothetical protein [Pseudocyphellaria aurata]
MALGMPPRGIGFRCLAILFNALMTWSKRSSTAGIDAGASLALAATGAVKALEETLLEPGGAGKELDKTGAIAGGTEETSANKTGAIAGGTEGTSANKTGAIAGGTDKTDSAAGTIGKSMGTSDKSPERAGSRTAK